MRHYAIICCTCLAAVVSVSAAKADDSESSYYRMDSDPAESSPHESSSYRLSEEEPETVGTVKWPAKGSTSVKPVAEEDASTAKARRDISPKSATRQPVEDPAEKFYHEGEFTHRDENDNIVAEGEYLKGRRIGTWTRWYAEGEGDLFSAEAHKDFERPFSGEVKFVDGKITGPWTVADSKGRKIGQWTLVGKRPHGKCTWWYANGKKMREVEYVDGLVHGELKEWDEAGKLIASEVYASGRRLRTETDWYSPGKKRTEGDYLLAGSVHRCQCDWWSAGVETELVEEHAKDQKYGLWTSWYLNGQVQMQGTYEDGEPSGEFVWYYPNGQMHIHGEFLAGQQSGTWTWWYAAGMKQRKGEYADGRETGRWISYREDGTVSGSELADASSRSAPRAANPLDEPVLVSDLHTLTDTAAPRVVKRPQPQPASPRVAQRPSQTPSSRPTRNTAAPTSSRPSTQPKASSVTKSNSGSSTSSRSTTGPDDGPRQAKKPTRPKGLFGIFQ